MKRATLLAFGAEPIGAEQEMSPSGQDHEPELRGQGRYGNTIIFLHVAPGRTGSDTPSRIDWVADDRSGIGHGMSSDDEPRRSGAVDFALLKTQQMPTVVANIATALANPDARVYSRQPVDDTKHLDRLLKAGGWTGDIEIFDFSDCLVDESLVLFTPSSGKVDQGMIQQTASRLIATARAQHGIDCPDDDSTSVAWMLWLTWRSLRAQVDKVASDRMVEASNCFFWASKDNVHVRVGPASERELTALPIASRAARAAEVAAWTLVAIRDPRTATTIHVLGQAEGTKECLLSPPLIAADWTVDVAMAQGGQSYRLSGPAQGALQPRLEAHLRGALESWGFERIRG